MDSVAAKHGDVDGQVGLGAERRFQLRKYSKGMIQRVGIAQALLNDPETPLINRAVQSRYPPGSTWKIPMAIAGLQQGAITLERSNLVCGGGITIGVPDLPKHRADYDLVRAMRASISVLGPKRSGRGIGVPVPSSVTRKSPDRLIDAS